MDIETNNELSNVYEDNTLPNTPTPLNQSNGVLNAILETVIYIVAILVSVVVIRHFFIAPFSVDGASMNPNLSHGELIIVNKIGYSELFGYKFGEPERGDIVVIIPPNDTSKFYVKRLIGLPNEKIEFTNGEVIVHNDSYPQGVRLDEDYLSYNNRYTNPPGGYRNKTISLHERDYYVLGDNRAHSHDSRAFGAINKSSIVGKVWFIAWPFEKIHIVKHYIYSLFRLTYHL